MLTRQEIASMIDHALLKPNLTDLEIIEGCKVARYFRVAAVCVRPCDVKTAGEVLRESGIAVATVIGFPHGTTTTRCKVAESKEAIADGAKELDMVINIGKMKSGSYHYVMEDIHAVVNLAHQEQVLLKVIFENCYLTKDEKIRACAMVNEAGADFAKTSTGFGPGGATEDDVLLMREHCLPQIQIKAAGGIKTMAQAKRFCELGCRRLGCSTTAEILKER
jgi:deoxyribose-phosphate aldolase